MNTPSRPEQFIGEMESQLNSTVPVCPALSVNCTSYQWKIKPFSAGCLAEVEPGSYKVPARLVWRVLRCSEPPQRLTDLVRASLGLSQRL